MNKNVNVLIKGGVICAISMVLIFALSIIGAKVNERNGFQAQAKRTIAAGWSTRQTFVGPVIYLSFSKQVPDRYFDKNMEQYVATEKTVKWNEIIIPEQLDIVSNTKIQFRQKGIFKLPVYQTELSMSGHFRQTKPFTVKPKKVELIVAMNDRRGLAGNQTITWNQERLPFQSGVDSKLLGGHLTIELDELDSAAPYAFNMDTQFKGMDELNFVPSAKQFSLLINSNWPHPYFGGRYLPDSRKIGADGFSASWQLSHFATSIESTMSDCARDYKNCQMGSLKNSLGIGFHSPIDIYQKTDRALKYGFMFILLTFVVFFAFECLKRLSIHPVQYSLVGFALALFFLVLISLSEHMGFNNAYLLAVIICIALIACYLKVVFKTWKYSGLMSAGLLLLYIMLFFILKSEDFALLMGTGLLFAVLATIMYSTRKIDWYAIARVSASSKAMDSDTKATS